MSGAKLRLDARGVRELDVVFGGQWVGRVVLKGGPDSVKAAAALLTVVNGEAPPRELDVAGETSTAQRTLELDAKQRQAGEADDDDDELAHLWGPMAGTV